MNEEINELLSIYKQEKELIESLIKEDEIDHDYRAVYLKSKILNRIKHQIRTIELFIDPHLQEKEQLKRRSDFFAEMDRNGLAKDYYAFQLEKINHELEQLNNFTPGYFNDGQEFDDAVFNLVENKISAFIFNLRKEENLYLKFSVKKNKIIIRLTPFADILASNYFIKSTINVLKQIGFKKNKSRTCFQMKYPLESFKDAIPVKTIASRVIYEAFYNYRINQSTTLEIIP
ncbi:hypothetical protein [Pedobacter zeae]|uniref:Uncharacterized protein n=1 Tax=Pedobacter zeae TaxID=1737356 RepID=A0A7W6KBZ7_9SPHI|nr:hypothetical protein [Pedobacter zeae]MBB4108986.1 hypothetical protein [Pedobacter zeae]GGH09564.1 hypothetical protein GCM10007422_27730 [Pedobacter zeae]